MENNGNYCLGFRVILALSRDTGKKMEIAV